MSYNDYSGQDQRFASSSGTSYGGGGGYGGIMEDFSSAVDHASNHAGSNGDRGLFGQALSILSGQHEHIANQHLDEQDAIQQHQAFFNSDDPPNQPSSGSMGAAAAMQALKMFTSSQTSGSFGSNQNQFIGVAMGEASRLFDQQNASGNLASGASKQDAVSSAAKMALQMYMKSEMGGGGSGSGRLMSAASRLWS